MFKYEFHEVEGKEQYHIKISNRFAALKNFDTEVDTGSAWVTITENNKISAKDTSSVHNSLDS
jgi:hypothetical protein